MHPQKTREKERKKRRNDEILFGGTVRKPMKTEDRVWIICLKNDEKLCKKIK